MTKHLRLLPRLLFMNTVAAFGIDRITTDDPEMLGEALR